MGLRAGGAAGGGDLEDEGDGVGEAGIGEGEGDGKGGVEIDCGVGGGRDEVVIWLAWDGAVGERRCVQGVEQTGREGLEAIISLDCLAVGPRGAGEVVF